MQNKIDENLIKEMLDSSDPVFAYIQLPEEQKTESISLALVEYDPESIRYVPDSSLSKDVVYTAVSHDVNLLKTLPDSVLDKDLYVYAVTKKPIEAIDLIPYHLRKSNAIWRAFVDNFPVHLPDTYDYISKIPYPDLIKETYDKIIAKDQDWKYILIARINPDLMPKQLLEVALEVRPEILMNVIQKDPVVLNHLPNYLNKEEVYRDAVKQNGNNLIYVPSGYRSKELCQIAIKNTFGDNPQLYNVFRAIPYTDLQIDSIKKISDPIVALGFYQVIPNKEGNVELLNEVCKLNGEAVMYAPDGLLNQEICINAVRNKPEVVILLPEECRTPEVWLCVSKGNPERYVPPEIILGVNIFSFNQKMEESTGKSFSFDEIHSLYHGRPFLLNASQEQSWGKWDRIQSKFVECESPLEQKQQNKNQMKL